MPILSTKAARWMLLPGCALLAITLVGPLLTTLVFSLGERAANGGYQPALTLTNFIDIATRSSAYLSTLKLAGLGPRPARWSACRSPISSPSA